MYDKDSVRHIDSDGDVPDWCGHILQYDVSGCIAHNYHVRSSVPLPAVLD